MLNYNTNDYLKRKELYWKSIAIASNTLNSTEHDGFI